MKNTKEYIELLEQRQKMDLEDRHELNAYRELFHNHLFDLKTLNYCLCFQIRDALQCGLTMKNLGE